jgi:hypothetical protein
MFTLRHERAYDSQNHRIQENVALESSGDENGLESTYAPVTTFSSRHLSIRLPAQEFSSSPPIQQPAHDLSLPVRGRHEPQIENRRVSIAASGTLSGAASHLANQDSGAWYSHEGYQQAVAQLQARRSRSKPLRLGPGTSYSQQQPLQAPVTMRYVKYSVFRSSY